MKKVDEILSSDLGGIFCSLFSHWQDEELSNKYKLVIYRNSTLTLSQCKKVAISASK